MAEFYHVKLTDTPVQTWELRRKHSDAGVTGVSAIFYDLGLVEVVTEYLNKREKEIQEAYKNRTQKI